MSPLALGIGLGIPFQAQGGGVSTSQISAVVYDGIGDYLKHTGGPTGAADGTDFLYAWRGKVEADSAAYTFLEIRNGSGVVLSVRRTATNTIEFKGWDSTAVTSVFSCVTTGTLLTTDSWVTLVCSARGTHASVALVKSASTVTGTNTPGTANNIDLTADWYFGSSNASSEFLDATVYTQFADAIYIDAEDAYFQRQFYNAGAMVDLGADGSTPYGSSPLVFHQNGSATHATNSGTGGDADAGNVTEALADPTTEDAVTNAFDLLLASAAWWSADHSENTVVTTEFDVLTDRTANGNDLTAASSTQRPTRVSSGGLVYADFDGATDRMTKTSGTSALMNNFNAGGSYAGVVQWDTAGGFGRLWCKPDFGEAILVDVGTTIGIFLDHATTNQHSQITISTAAVHVIDMRIDKSLIDETDIVFGLNGTDNTIGSGLTSVAAPSGAATDLSAQALHVGNRVTDNRNFDGRIYEMAFADSKWSTAEMARVRTHFADKYGVTLS